jgi:hypothetical protein
MQALRICRKQQREEEKQKLLQQLTFSFL